MTCQRLAPADDHRRPQIAPFPEISNVTFFSVSLQYCYNPNGNRKGWQCESVRFSFGLFEIGLEMNGLSLA